MEGAPQGKPVSPVDRRRAMPMPPCLTDEGSASRLAEDHAEGNGRTGGGDADDGVEQDPGRQPILSAPGTISRRRPRIGHSSQLFVNKTSFMITIDEWVGERGSGRSRPVAPIHGR
jgi:hypothetical protein